jgi:elongation factor 1-gamma
MYLADTAPNPGKREQLLGASPQERARIQQWLWFSFMHLEPTLTTLCVWRFGTGQFASYDAAAEEKAEAELRRWLGYLEASVKTAMEKQTWLAGTEAPSIADLTVCGNLHSGFMLYVDAEMRKEYPVVVEYFERLLSEVPEIKYLYDLDGKWAEVRKQPDTAV